MKWLLAFSILMGTSMVLGQTRMISHVTRPDGGFTTDLLIENLAVGQNTFTLTPYNEAGESQGAIRPTLDSLETVQMNSSEWFPGLDVSHVVIEGVDVRVTAAYRSASGNPSPAHVPESNTSAVRYRIFAGNWDVVFDGLAMVNLGAGATDIRIAQKTFDGEEQQVVLAAEALPSMGKALFVLGGPAVDVFEPREDVYYEIYGDQPFALTSLRGNQPGSTFLWVNQAEIHNPAILKVTNDAPEKTGCEAYLNLGNDARDDNNMPQAEVMIDVSEDGRLAACAKDYRFGPTDNNVYNVRVWSGLYTSPDKGGRWKNTTFDESNPDIGIMATTQGDFGVPANQTIHFLQQSDPVVGFDRDGNLYTNALLFSSTFAPNVSALQEPSAQIITRMDKDGQVVPGTTHFVGVEDSPELFNDKNWIAVDRSAPVEETVVALVWKLFIGPNATVPGGGYVAVSADGASTFSSPIKLPIPEPENTNSQTYQPLIGTDPSNGRKTLFVVTRDIDVNTFALNFYLMKAPVDGITPGDTGALAAQLSNPSNWTYVRQPIGGLFAYGGSSFGENFRFSSYFVPAMDRTTGEIFVVAPAFDPVTQGSRTVICKSSDGGLTWTTPKVINYQNPSHQIFPTVACHSGVVSVIWYDTRHDDSFTPFTAFDKMDLYYAALDYNLNVLQVERLTKQSQPAKVQTFVRDNGIPGKQSGRVAPHDFDWPGFIGAGLGAYVPPRKNAGKVCQSYGFIGDYIGITADKDFAYMTWCDMRDIKPSSDDPCVTAVCDGRRNQNIYFARIRKTQAQQKLAQPAEMAARD